MNCPPTLDSRLRGNDTAQREYAIIRSWHRVFASFETRSESQRNGNAFLIPYLPAGTGVAGHHLGK